MIKNLSVCSPSPVGSLFSSSSLFRLSLLQRPGIAVGIAFALLSLILSTSSASAQTRRKRANVKSEERSRRVTDKEQTGAGEPIKLSNTKQAEQPHVRKTAMTYSPAMGNKSEARPALTNDIVIISRAEETSPARKLGARKVGNNIPSIWPVVGNLRSGVGMRNNPFGGPGVEFHKGQDISAPSGTPVHATADGVVIIAGWLRGYGQVVYIDHGNGISTRYGHLSRIDATVGQLIRQGEQLGLVGSTGRSTGPHLHYEVRINGEPTSPLPYLPSVAQQPDIQAGGQD
jgi:murein DD-endopeptidase MepM/ murein hydrolase activator NlpD